MNRIRYGNSVISYTVVKTKRRKTTEIIVDENRIEVRTPLTKKDSEIKQLVDDKKQWIFKKKLEFSDKIKRKQTNVKTRTAEYIEKRTWELASKIGIIPSKVVVKNLKSRWGSATKTGIINLSIALTKAPTKVIDYIIIHELCHLKVNNHSAKFWNLLYTYDKTYQRKIVWLETHKVI